MERSSGTVDSPHRERCGTVANRTEILGGWPTQEVNHTMGQVDAWWPTVPREDGCLDLPVAVQVHRIVQPLEVAVIERGDDAAAVQTDGDVRRAVPLEGGRDRRAGLSLLWPSGGGGLPPPGEVDGLLRIGWRSIHDPI